MPTIGEACTILRLSRRSLELWMHRLDITPKPHPLDFRYHILTDEQVQLLADTLAQRPDRSVLPARSTAPVTRIRRPVNAPRPPGEPLSAPQGHPGDDGLPEGWIGWREMCRVHHVPESTAQKALDTGRLPCHTGHWKTGRVWTSACAGCRSSKRSSCGCGHAASCCSDLGTSAPLPWPYRSPDHPHRPALKRLQGHHARRHHPR